MPDLDRIIRIVSQVVPPTNPATYSLDTRIWASVIQSVESAQFAADAGGLLSLQRDATKAWRIRWDPVLAKEFANDNRKWVEDDGRWWEVTAVAEDPRRRRSFFQLQANESPAPLDVP